MRRLKIAEETGREPWEPYPHQVPPEGDWDVWGLLGGRGSGKTDGAAAYFDEWLTAHPGSRGRIIAPTLGDAVHACVRGVSGILAHNPRVRMVSQPGGIIVYWPNGSEAKLFGAFSSEDVERLRAGGNSHIDWCEELAAWRQLQDAWDQKEFGLRLGTHPHTIFSSTPKPRPFFVALVRDERTAITTAHTDDNPKLPEVTRRKLYKRYAGTRLGRQELAAEILEDNPGALWKREAIERDRRHDMPALQRIVVAVDPAVTATETSDETGIITGGIGTCGCKGFAEVHGFVLHDHSLRGSPNEWGRAAVGAYHLASADRIVGEVNNGGDLVEMNIRTVDEMASYKPVRASRGKAIRAEPIAALYEQGKVHHIGYFPELEDQLCTWEPGDPDSPDRLDALVWLFTELMLELEDGEYVVEFEDPDLEISPI